MYIQDKPLICLSNDSNFFQTHGEAPRQIHSPKAYGAAIAAAGGIPMLTCEQCAEEMAELCEGLLLSGGDDVDPELYGETILTDTVGPDPERTQFEVPLARAFLERGKPILTICRGFQLLNVLLGGTLYQDLLEQKGWIHSNGKIRHDLYAEEGSILHALFGPVFKVNSTHHQAIKALAPGLRVTARSVEGIIEGYEHESLPIFGVQFHPERLTGVQWDSRTPDFKPFFERFIALVRAESARREGKA